jgi:SAM-dependent methyltransferase
MDAFDAGAVRRTYDAVAEEYAAKFGDDLADLAFDREMLDAVAEKAGAGGRVLDVGCGPGQVAAYLAARGVHAVGVDLSARALSIAHRRRPAVVVAAADMRRLPVRAGSCAGVVLFYSFHHLRRAEVPETVSELRRVLAPGGTLLIATHEGEGELTSEPEWLGHHVEVMGATLFTADELAAAVGRASFDVDAVRFRDPLPHEYQGPRVYLTAVAV